MESENVGVCKLSSSSHLDDLVHQRFFYDLSLQLVDSQKLLNPLLELSNCPVTQIRGVLATNADTIVLDSLSRYECMPSE